jgi:hypothetical protein
MSEYMEVAGLGTAAGMALVVIAWFTGWVISRILRIFKTITKV